jgi:hypothetical protein
LAYELNPEHTLFRARRRALSISIASHVPADWAGFDAESGII